MKRAALLGMCFFLGLNSGAMAFDTLEDAYAAMIEAGEALGAKAGSVDSTGDSSLAAALAGFGAVAAEARDAMDAHGGPIDLRCIYNGMAADAAKRAEELAAAGGAAERAAVVEDIAFLAEDAVLVTPETEADNAVTAGLPPMTCEASDETVDAADVASLLGS